MAWCENPTCGKKGLRKADVEFDENMNMVLCHGCYVQAHPGWMPPVEVVDLRDVVPQAPQVGYSFNFSDKDGLKASLSYGDISISFHAPTEDLRRLLGS
jgi:hypothetical protein